MPLTGNPKKDIPELMKSGRPQKQAVAIALKEKRKKGRKDRKKRRDRDRADNVLVPNGSLLDVNVARKVGLAFYHAGKSSGELLAYCGGDHRDEMFRQALGVYEQQKRRYSADDDRSSEEHEHEANRLEELAEKERDPKVKAKLKEKAEFHREEVGIDSVLREMRNDSAERDYALEKLTDSMKELKSRADRVFGRVSDMSNEMTRTASDDEEHAGPFGNDDDDCDDDEDIEADAGTGRSVR